MNLNWSGSMTMPGAFPKKPDGRIILKFQLLRYLPLPPLVFLHSVSIPTQKSLTALAI
jgi:hypothetical protein